MLRVGTKYGELAIAIENLKRTYFVLLSIERLILEHPKACLLKSKPI